MVLLQALNVLETICYSGKSLAQLGAGKKLPQILVNVRFSGDNDPLVNEAVLASVKTVEAGVGWQRPSIVKKVWY